MTNQILDFFSTPLRVSKRRRNAIERELSTHLHDLQSELEQAGWSPVDAARESTRRLGDPAIIAEQFREVYRPNHRRRIGLAFGCAGALFAGAYGAGSSLASATAAHHQSGSHLRPVAQTAPLPHHCKHLSRIPRQ